MLITSLSHPLVKHLKKLRINKSYRDEKKRIIITSLSLIKELISIITIKTLVSHQEVSLPAEIKVTMPKNLTKKILGFDTTDGFIAEIEMPLFQDISSKEKVLILDNINIPGNLGSILRSAHAMKFDGVYLLNNCCDPFNDKALRAAKIATFDLPLSLGPLPKNLNLYATAMKGTPLNEVKFQRPFGIIIGNEGHGITPELMKELTTITIPMHEKAESLNVSAASAIVMYRAYEY